MPNACASRWTAASRDSLANAHRRVYINSNPRRSPRPAVSWRRRSMPMLTVQVWDATGNKRQDVEMPDDAPLNRILAVLLEKMHFPQYAPDGQPLSYKFHHKPTGK